jgi:hypothetical protein
MSGYARVRDGSIAPFWPWTDDFRSTFNNGPRRNARPSPFRANSGGRGGLIDYGQLRPRADAR